MVKINPYLMVSNGKKAIELYKDLFGAKQVDHRPFEKEAGSYLGFPEDFDYENSTMHAELDISGATIMLSDNPMNKNRSGNVQILVNLDSKKDLEEIYEKIKKYSFEIIMDLQKTSWGFWFLVFEDSFGIGWQISVPEAY
jgi:uncharacterized glyoxalase superfamily protein PhnB